MDADDLPDSDQPAGGAPRALLLAWTALVVLLILGVGAVALLGSPADGSPRAGFDVAPISKTAGTKPPAHVANVNLIGAGKQPTASQPGSATTPPVLPPNTAIPPNISKAIYAGAALVADPDLIEPSLNGPLPRIANDGRTPMTAYAPPLPNVKGPRIAVVVSGLGISAKQTAAAIDNLPAGITLAFVPYTDDIQRWVSEARKHGHEVLLEIPMEPYDFPDSDPGPHTLRAGTGEDSNTDRLTWSLTRFTGYAGVTNLLGSRFMADNASLEPVMTFLSRRGLFFFDSGAATHSVAPDVAKQIAAPFVQSVETIDSIQTGMEIDQQLSKLEARARQDGQAAATGFVYPVTVDRLANWAKGLPGRGFVLVPASAIVTPSK